MSVLVAAAPLSARTSDRTALSLPGIPNFRLPSAGVVNTVFPAATGGRTPYTYSLSGQPPGITFSPSTRVASGTLPTVWVDTTYTVTYSVRDRAGASASVTFTATVRPPASVPPLSLPGIPNSRVPSGGVVNTLFPAATGGRAPYAYSLSGLPPGITFSSATRVASGTLPTVTTDTTYTITYSVRDSRGATDSTSFTATVTARRIVVRPVPGPPPTEDPDPPPTVVIRVYRLPFTESETGEGEKSYSFRLDSRTDVSVSLTGMNRDIDCRVNGSSCTNRGGTSADSWSGTLDAGTHSVTVYPYGGGSGSWTVSVSGTATSPPTPAPTPTPPPTTPPTTGPIVKTGVNVSSSRTYLLRLSGRVDVSVELTGMTTDFDCTVSGNRCTNRGSTRDDSWSGTLDAGDHKIVVYPYGGGSGNYTLTVSAEASEMGGSTGTRTQVTTLVDVSRTGVSASQTHSFTLSGPAEVDVALTGLSIDFDCRVGSSRCTNRWGTLDDSWNGNLTEGHHSVVVYPYDPGPGNYSLTVTATETVNSVSTPLAGGPTLVGRICDADEDGNAIEDTCQNVYADVTTVTGEDPGPPPGTGPGEGTTGPGGGGDGGDGGGGGGGGTPGPTPSGSSLAAATSDINCQGWNIDDGDGFDADRLNEDGTTRKHRALDIQVSSDDATFFALASGTIVNRATSPTCGHQIAVRLQSGGRHVYCHMDDESRLAEGTEVAAGDAVGTYGPSGVTFGPQLHLKVTDSNDSPIDPVEAAGGEGVMAAAGFTFNSSDAEQCAEE